MLAKWESNLEEARHMQEPAVRHEIEMANRCEQGHLSYEEVIEDYPYDPLSAFSNYELRPTVVPIDTSIRGLPRHEAACDLSERDNYGDFFGKIIGEDRPQVLPRAA